MAVRDATGGKGAGRVQLGDFEGRWTLSRRIEDRLTGTEARFSGEAVLRPVPGGLAYREEGLLQLAGAPALTAVRDYLWREVAGRIVVAHGDGRPFHDFDPADPVARHWCDPDDYRVRYDFAGWPAWRAEWVVKGPRKDYTMWSGYSPAA